MTDLMNHRFETLDRDGAAIHAHSGWNHLARALLRLVLGNQEPNGAGSSST